MYLEGSDQHRGWFHSSLLQSCATRDKAPYKSILTHGFVLDEKGEKMSKSKGNVTTPEQVTKEYGADILRLWVAVSDYSADLRIGKEILKGAADKYRRLRNTIRWMLGALDGFDIQKDATSIDKLSFTHKWALHRLNTVSYKVLDAYNEYAFGKGFNILFDFCTNDLSAFYFDLSKDMLYCDAENDPDRQALRHILWIMTRRILKLMAPICPFTADEAWSYLFTDNVHENLSRKIANFMILKIHKPLKKWKNYV